MKIAICDDEPLFVGQVKMAIEMEMVKASEHEIDLYYSGEQLWEAYRNNQVYDMIFLDIELGTITGMAIAEQIRKKDKTVKIIFISAYPEYMPDAFDVAATQFLVKPLQTEQFKKVYYRCLDQFRNECKTIVFRVKDQWNKDYLKKISFQEIVVMEVQKQNVVVYLHSGENFTIKYSMKDLEKLTTAHGFVRVHSGCLINLNYIKNIELPIKDISVCIGDEHKIIPVSRGRKKEFLNQYMKYQLDIVRNKV